MTMDFDKSVFETVKHETKVIINDVEYKGFGIGKANQGLLSSVLTHDFAFDPELLAVHLIVGYPSYSEYKPGTTDLFKPSTMLGGYKYQRKYRFSNGACFTSHHNITFNPETGLRGVFSTRNFPATAFGTGKWAVQDLVETFIPAGPGLIKSVMAAEWLGEKGEELNAIIESEYMLNHNETLPGLHWRHVTFETDKSVKGQYVQSEKITVHKVLFDGAPQNLLKSEMEGVKSKASQKLNGEAGAVQATVGVK